MIKEFKEFLLKQNALALAVGVIIGGAMGRVVSSLVADLIMPMISMGIPGGDWRAAKVVLSQSVGPDGKPIVNALNYGTFAGTVVDFVVVAFAVFMIMKIFLKPAPEAPAPPAPATKTCGFCQETVPAAATRCRACTSQL